MRRLLTAAATALVAGAGATAAAAPASAAPLDPAGGLGFDFGCAASPVADGYLQVANTTTYEAERGYGLSTATDCRNRGDGDLLGDFTNAAGYSFLVDLPDGDYHVIVYSGDAIASNRTTVTVEGVNLGEIFSAAGEYGNVTTVAAVNDGQLEVTVGNNGRTNAVEIAPVATPTGLRVTGTTLVPQASVALAWDPVPEAAHYTVYRGSSTDDLAPLAETSEPAYLDEAVELGLGYTYAVSAQVGVVDSNRSDPVTVQLRDESVPVPATPGGFDLRATTTRSIALGWAAVDGAVLYYVYRSDSADGPFDRVATVDTTSYTGAPCGYELHTAATGEILWCVQTGRDTGRGTAGDIDPRFPGAEAWAVDGAFNSPTGGLHAADGTLVTNNIPGANHLIWWDGDPLREILDHDWEEPVGVGYIGEWDWQAGQTVRLLTAEGTRSNNGTKGNPALTADLFGDWREEAIWRLADESALRLYATPYPTEIRLPTLMHDPQYRLAVAWQNVAYNQPPHPSYFLGDGMALPPAPDIRTGAAIDASLALAPPVWPAPATPVVAIVDLPAGTGAATVATGTVRVLVDGAWVGIDAVRAVVGDRLLVTFDGAQIRGRSRVTAARSR